MAYLFLGTKATQASEQNDIIRINNKKAAAELEVDEKYSYQLYITLGLKDKEAAVENALEGTGAETELAELEQLKDDIIRLYEEIYGKHAEKHNLIETYLKNVDDAVNAIRDMCTEIDKELTKEVEDLSNEFQRRIDEITTKLNTIISNHIGDANTDISNAFNDIITKVSTLTNYDASTYQTFVNDALYKLEGYIESTTDTEAATKADFEAAVDKLVDFEGEDAPFQIDTVKDAEIYTESFKTAISADADTIKTKAAEIKKLTFEENNEEKTYTFNGEGDFEHDGATHDIDKDGKVYVYGETEPQHVNTDEPQNPSEPTDEPQNPSKPTDEPTVEPTSGDNANGDSEEEENQEHEG